MRRQLWVAGWFAVAAAWSSAFTLAILGTWVVGWRGWATAGVIALAAGPGTIAMGIWSTESTPTPNLPRAERRRIAAERARIETDRVIAELEREAGLR